MEAAFSSCGQREIKVPDTELAHGLTLCLAHRSNFTYIRVRGDPQLPRAGRPVQSHRPADENDTLSGEEALVMLVKSITDNRWLAGHALRREFGDG